MATPTPTTYTEWNGTRGYTYWKAVWTTADNFTDTAIVDISTLAPAPNSVKVIGIKAQLNGNITATLEFEATTDQLIYEFDNQVDSALIDSVDFRENPSGGRCPDKTAAGFVGDISLSTTGVANGDELILNIWYQKKT